MMANLSEDIQSAGSDTRPPMLDRETLGDGALGPERDRVVKDLTPEEKERFVTEVKMNRGLKTSNYDYVYSYLKQHEAHANENKMMLEKYTQYAIDPFAFVSNVSLQQYPTQSLAIPPFAYGRQNRVQGNNARGVVAAGNKGVQNRGGNANPGQENGVVLDEEQLIITGGKDSTFDDDVDEPLVQDLALNVDHVFQADQCDAFKSDVDEAPTAHTMFMANLSSADPIYDETGPSYDSNILYEVQDHDNYLDSVGEYHEVHEMQNNV
ncbi:hypothetical protein Tco_1195941 [Tanacetum coccineum]